ncbi:MAG: hypothetical protein JWO36_3082 [Myxococcales bacterium]|nr:hypothetical protein [Myxococcales bacterium]
MVSAVSELLSARRVGCSSIAAHLAAREAAIVVTSAGSETERVVADPASAATLIESWARNDIAEPLLQARVVPAAHEELVQVREVIVPVSVPAEPRGVSLFAVAESSFANDRTRWLGAQVGACVMVGPICAAARVRFARVADAPMSWQGSERSSTDLLVGGDLSVHLGRLTVTPGFAGGIGHMHTRVETGGNHRGSETGGLRAEVHTSMAYPLGHRLAFEVSATLDVTQATNFETTTTIPLPDEPQLLVRIGAGLRYGGL